MKDFLYNFLRKMKNGNYLYHFLLYPIKRNKITVVNYHGKGYGDNAKYIVENLTGNYDIVWLVNDINTKVRFPKNVRLVKYGSYRALKEMATSMFWIDNSRKDYYPPKKSKQLYIQTWHSPLRLKKIEKDAESKLSHSYIQKAKDDAKLTDLMVSGSSFSTNLYKNSFWYDGEVLEVGTPRCDIFFKNDNFATKNKVDEYFKQDEDTKYILYAPTFRKEFNKSTYSFDFEEVIATVEKKFGGRYTLLLRLHPNIAKSSNFLKYNDKVINASFYDDMQELLVSSEILITDYSSSMFDFLIARKKCFLYANDLENYLVENRGIYFNINELPFSCSTSSDSLIKDISEFNSNLYSKKIEEFYVNVGMFENGTASKNLAKWMEERIIVNEKI